MATSLNELAYDLLNTRREKIKETDSLDIRTVVDWIQSQRARLLKQQLGKPLAHIDPTFVQNLGKTTPVVMEKVNASLISNISTGDFMWRTTIEIPMTIDNPNGTGTFYRVGPANKLRESFTVVTYERALRSGHGKFNHNNIYAFVLEPYLYLHSKSGYHFTAKYLDVQGVFPDAIQAALIADPTWTWDDEYPITKTMIDQLKTLIIQERLGLIMVQAVDKTDDQEDNPTVPQAKTS